jgi:hypothetical protein
MMVNGIPEIKIVLPETMPIERAAKMFATERGLS